LSLLVLVAATVVFYGILPGGPSELIADAAPPVAEQAAPAPVSATEILNPSPVEETPQPNRDAGTQASEKLVSPAPLPQKRQSGVANSDISRPGGSDDSAVSVPPVLSPRGIEPDQANAEIVVNDLLQMLGVNAELVGGDWIVRSTTSNSLAARAGVQADDVIEAVDDHILSAKTRIKGLLGARSCSVRRAGKVLRLDLRK
jgi:C-terminal processing protease CtpA/Prc